MIDPNPENGCEYGDITYFPYKYYYERGSQQIRFGNIDTNISSTRAEYYLASNPFDASSQPDNESHFSGSLARTYREYTTSQGVSAYVIQTDFDVDSKPWASDTIEKKGWRIENARLLLKWNIAGGFTY